MRCFSWRGEVRNANGWKFGVNYHAPAALARSGTEWSGMGLHPTAVSAATAPSHYSIPSSYMLPLACSGFQPPVAGWNATLKCKRTVAPQKCICTRAATL